MIIFFTSHNFSLKHLKFQVLFSYKLILIAHPFKQNSDHHIVVTSGHQSDSNCRSEVFDFKNPDYICDDLPACYGGEGSFSGLIGGRPITCGGGPTCCGSYGCRDLLSEEYE